MFAGRTLAAYTTGLARQRLIAAGDKLVLKLAFAPGNRTFLQRARRLVRTGHTLTVKVTVGKAALSAARISFAVSATREIVLAMFRPSKKNESVRSVS